jgi:glycerol-3-phosphate dehydrogenase
MKRDLAELDGKSFDLLVVGGGIFGACAACDAAQRGLRVALIERGDFCSAASANSFKLVHGGLRYLQHADLRRVRESSAARRAFLRVAPHLAHPLPIVVPTYGNGMKSKWAMATAMTVYDALTFDRNEGIPDPSRHIPRGRLLSRSEVLDRYPGLDPEGLTGAAVFFDGQMYNPPRLVLAFVKSAAEAGAVTANYVEATRFLRTGQRVDRIEARDRLTGRILNIRARCVLNAAGPYAEGLLERGLGRGISPTQWSRDAYFVVARPLVEGSAALALPSRTRDPEALLSRGARHLFLIPWRKYTLAGVWHKVYQGDPDHYSVSDEELDQFVEEIRSSYGGLDITPDDISIWNAGLIPFGENDPEARDLKFGHRSRLVDHEAEQGLRGLVTLIGVRFTTAPCEAVKAVDLVIRKTGATAAQSKLTRTPVDGGDIRDFQSLVTEVRSAREVSLPAPFADALVHNHGSRYRRVLDLVQERRELGEPIGSSTVLKAEVVYAVREEMARTLADVLLRRTDLGSGEYPGEPALRDSARLMARELGWNEVKVEREIGDTQACYPARMRREKALTTPIPAETSQA